MLKDRKLPGKRQILQALVASVPEAQGLQAARQTSQTPSSGCKRARLQAARQTSRSSRTAGCQANVTSSKLWLKLKDCKLPGKRHEAQGLQAVRQTSHHPSFGCKCTRSSWTARCQANVTLSKLWSQTYPKLEDCKPPCEHHEAQGLQVARRTSHSASSGCRCTRSSRTASCFEKRTWWGKGGGIGSQKLTGMFL